MLEFLIDKKPLILDITASVRLTWRNPACNFRDFPGDIGLGIDIPVNDHNRMMLQHPDRFERRAGTKVKEFDGFEIRYGGVLLMGGTFIVQSASNEKYSGWLRSNLGNLGKYHREKYIYESISFNEEKLFVNKADYDPSTDDYACPQILNPEFFREKGEKVTLTRQVENPDYVELSWWQDIWRKQEPQTIPEEYETEDLTAAFLRATAGFVNKKNDDGSVYAPDTTSLSDAYSIAQGLDVAVVSPMLFLNYLLRTLFKDAGFHIRSNFIETDPDLCRLLVYNNYDITAIKYSLAEGEVWENYDWNYGEGLSDFDRATGIKVGNIVRDVHSPFFYKSLVPKIRIKDFLIGLQNLLNICFVFNPKRRIIDIIDREDIVRGETIDISNYLSGFWVMGEQKDTTLKFTFDHDPGDVLFQEQFTDIDKFRDNEKEPVESFADLQAIESPGWDEIRYIKGENRYVQYKLWLFELTNALGETEQQKYLGWDHLTCGFQHGYFNRKKELLEEIKTGFSTISGDQTTLTYQKGNIRSELFAFENFTPRLLFYLGNNNGKYETANISLDWEKPETGLLGTRWRNWSRAWAQRQEVNSEADFPLNVLDYVIRNIYRKFRSNEGVFIIEEMETEFGLNRIGQTRITGYKFNYAPDTITASGEITATDTLREDEILEM